MDTKQYTTFINAEDMRPVAIKKYSDKEYQEHIILIKKPYNKRRNILFIMEMIFLMISLAISSDIYYPIEGIDATTHYKLLCYATKNECESAKCGEVLRINLTL